MDDMPLPECLGTVVIHEYDAVTCTKDTCPRDMALESWFSHHTSFMTCKADDCPYCEFNAPVEDSDGMPTLRATRGRKGRLLRPEFPRHASPSASKVPSDP
jgi:hypothetical protein